MTFKLKPIWTILVLAVGLGTPALAEIAKVNMDSSGVTIEGYDPVAYFERSRPVKGLEKFRVIHAGATYLFSSNHHKTLFRKNPATYIPEYGGYCAFGMRYGQTSRIDPHAWNIVDGKLYLSLNHGTQAIWKTNMGENITIANELWGKLKNTN